MTNWVESGRQYARDVISGTIPACKWIKLACERTERDHERHDGAYRFDASRASAPCEFISEFKFVQDSIKTMAGEPFRLLPWQLWILTTVFGWLWRDTGNRRYRRSYIEVGRGNGKSTLSAGVTQYIAFGEGVRGAQCICAASEMSEPAEIARLSMKAIVIGTFAFKIASRIFVAASTRPPKVLT